MNPKARRRINAMRLVFFSALTIAVPSANAAYMAITYDETLFQTTDTLDSSLLIANVWLDVSGTTLKVKIQNISPDAAANGAAAEVAGFFFNLPTGVSVTYGGDAKKSSGSTYFNGGTDAVMKTKWGWDYALGGVSGGAAAYALNDYDARGGTIASDGKHAFSDTAAGGAEPSATGVNYGAVSLAETSGPGHAYVKDTIILTFQLDANGSASGYGTLPTDLRTYIDSHSTAISFGSATARVGVPDSGGSVLLLGLGLAGLALVRRRFV